MSWLRAHWAERPEKQPPYSNLCYAAVAKAVAHEREWTQEEIARRVVPWPKPKDLTRPRRLSTALGVVGALRRFGPYGGTSSDRNALLTALREGFSARGLAAGAWLAPGHVVAVVAVHDERDLLEVWDPSPGNPDRTGVYSSTAFYDVGARWVYFCRDQLEC